MTSRTAAVRYARALFDVALKERADLSAIEAELVSFADLFTAHPLLAKVLLNPAVPTPRKRATVVELTRDAGLAPILEKLLILLAERDRLVLLPELVAAYSERLAEHQKIIRAKVTTATPLESDRIQKIQQSLSRATGRGVTLTADVDPTIIGGLVARVGSTVYDASVTRQLEKMRRQLTDRL